MSVSEAISRWLYGSAVQKSPLLTTIAGPTEHAASDQRISALDKPSDIKANIDDSVHPGFSTTNLSIPPAPIALPRYFLNGTYHLV